MVGIFLKVPQKKVTRKCPKKVQKHPKTCFAGKQRGTKTSELAQVCPLAEQLVGDMVGPFQ